jgi:ubiquinone/menaquinone biosynthesis C-methylase UbiE
MGKQADLAGRLSHAAAAAAKTAWFGAHYIAARRGAGPVLADGEKLKLTHPLPKLGDILGAIRALVAADRANVERGFYPAPDGPPLNLSGAAKLSRHFLADARLVARRRREGSGQEVADVRPDLPRYYRQNFHYQTDGYLSADSAALYDFQVETLFGGTAQAMRRQALPLLAEAFAGRDQRGLKLLEIGCGTGALTAEIARAFPRLAMTAIDPSPDYLEAARKRLAQAPAVTFAEGFGERLDVADGAFDAAASCYLFHELPPKIRKAVAGELARAVKPGGFYVHVDSLQHGDTPVFDGLLEAFPALFHEPYYESYRKLDLDALFGAAGFQRVRAVTGFLTKAVLYRRV